MQVSEVQYELDADEGQDHGQAGGEVDETVQQARDEKEQGAEPEQRKRVGDEHDVGVLRHPEHRRDRVQGKQHVGAADGHEHQEQRRRDPASADAVRSFEPS